MKTGIGRSDRTRDERAGDRAAKRRLCRMVPAAKYTGVIATAAGVPVLRAPGRNANAVAELAVALLFAATRGVVPADQDVRQGEIYRDGKIP